MRHQSTLPHAKPFWAVYAVFGLAVGAVRWLWLRLLRAATWLNPDEAARELFGGVETSYSGSAGGPSFFIDAGWLRSIWPRLSRRR